MTTTMTAPPVATPQYKQSTIYKHLDLLEHLIDDAVGLYKYKFINADDFLDVLDKARARLPEELREAADVLQQRDEIVAEANRRAEQIITASRRQAENMLHESELLKAVQAEVERIRKQVVTEVEQMRREALGEAENIRNEAEQDATRTREGADHYAESVLTRIDADLNNLGQRLVESQSIVRNGQRLLGQAKQRHGTLGALTATVAPIQQQIPLSSPLLNGPTQ
jgi:F0F1-type ATP synthase membrane subunit b/b'